ncbi:MAG: alpha/beta fold hydrolase [Thermoleophilia bacterium]
MLHASPGSARLLHGLIRRLLPGRPVLALDTLGNGESDRPPGWDRPHGVPAAPIAPWDAPTIADYAGVVAEALDALGLDEVDVYGSHTGGLIGMELAILLGPGRVRGLVVDGVTLSRPTRSIATSRATPRRSSPPGTGRTWRSRGSSCARRCSTGRGTTRPGERSAGWSRSPPRRSTPGSSSC